MLTVRKNIVLAPYTTFGIGGPADFFIIASSQEDILEAIAFAKEKNLPYFLLGTGANILIGDKGFRGLVIKNETNKFSINGSVVVSESGVVMSDLINATIQKGLSGLEHFAGIPSTVGGALWQNLHFLTPDRSETFYIGDILFSATILTSVGKKQTVERDYFQFTYDWSILHKTKDIVLQASFELFPEEKRELQKRFDANIKWRDEKHPKGASKISAGSIFKKIEGYGAGRLIQQVGLKGKQIGKAKISERHANFILNTGGATAKDVRELITLVQETAKLELGLDMQTEITFVGEFK